MAVNPSTNKVYVADYDSNTMYVIDGSTETLAAKINLGECQCKPSGVAVNPSTNQIFVADYGNGWVTVVDGNTSNLANEPAITPGGVEMDRAGFVPLTPFGIAVNPSTKTIYVTQDGSPGGFFTIDGTTHKIDLVVPTGQDYSVAVAINPSTNTVYVANYGSNTTPVIDGSTGAVRANIAVGGRPYDVAVSPSTNTVYVANSASNTVSVIDGSTNSVKATIQVGNFPDGVAVNPSSNTVYVANYGSNTTSVIDGSTNNVAGTIAVGGGPTYIAVNPSSNTVYVVDNQAGAISVIASASSLSSTTPEFPTGLLGVIVFAALAVVAVISRKVPLGQTA
jgi:YVTN family beta-propeller protein